MSENVRKIYNAVIFEYNHDDAVNMAIFLLPTLLGVVLSGALQYWKLPYQLVAITTGGIFGALGSFFTVFNQEALHSWDPAIIGMLVMPPVILKLIYDVDTYLLLKSLNQILLISTVGVMSFTITFGFMMLVITNMDYSLVNIALAGILFVPNDVPDMILELDGIRNLQIIMYGESIFGTAVCLMTIEICLGAYEHSVTLWYQVVSVIVRFILVSTGVGIGFGMLIAYFVRKSYDDALNAITAIIAGCYLAYIICDMLLYTNPIIAEFIIVYYVAQERNRLSSEVDTAIIDFLNTCYLTVEVIATVAVSNFLIMTAIPHIDYIQIAISLAVYVVGNCFRLLSFVILSPILSRIGYGMDFTTLIAIFWAAKKGPMMMLHSLHLNHSHIKLDTIGTAMLTYTIIYVFLTVAVNGTTLAFILKKFGLIKFSYARSYNISAGLRVVHEKKARLVAMMKMNRYFADANWPMINGATKLMNPYQDESVGPDENLDFEDGLTGWKRQTICPTCTKTVAVEPTKRDILEMTREANIKALKSARVSFIRQFEHGYLNKNDLRCLQQCIDVAMDSKELYIKLDDLLRIFRDRKIVENTKKIMAKFKMDDNIVMPRQRWRRWCYRLSTSIGYESVICFIIVVNCFYIFIDLSLSSILEPIYRLIVCVCVTTFFTAEVAIKISAFSAYSVKEGFKLYFKNRWNVLDFVALCTNYLQVGESLYYSLSEQNNLLIYWIWQAILSLRAFRIGHLLKLFSRLGPRFIRQAELKVDEKVSYAFTMAKALITAYEEVVEQLHDLSENERIRDQLRIRFDNDKLGIARELGLIEKERPCIGVTIKTKHAIKATLMCIKNSIYELKLSGFVDNYEYEMLMKELHNCMRFVKEVHTLEPVTPEKLFFELPWLGNDEKVDRFLYDNVTIKIWKTGDTICEPNNNIDGVILVVAGVLLEIYVPCEELLSNLANYGNLPNKGHWNNTRFDDMQEEYILKGNSIGEQTVLTGRPHHCKVISVAPTQAFILSSKVIWDAIRMCADPVNGLAAKIWKHISMRLVRRLLLNTPMYQSMDYDSMNMILDRAFVPDLEHYLVLEFSDWIEDAILIEGMIVDFNTREIFTAPCYVPRTAQRIILHADSLTKIMMIPIKDMEAYDIMQQTQAWSQLDGEYPDLYERFKKKAQRIKRNTIGSRLIKTRGPQASGIAGSSTVGHFSVLDSYWSVNADKSSFSPGTSVSSQEASSVQFSDDGHKLSIGKAFATTLKDIKFK